jgi:hypothetical protein
MKLSLTLSCLFTASFLWCQGFSLNTEASTNEGNSSERLAEVESDRRPVKDVGSGTLKESMAEYDISAVQTSRSLQYMMYHWVQRGDTISADSSSISREEFGASVALSRKGTLLVVGAPTADLGTPDDNGEHDGKIEIYELVDSEWNLVQTIPGVSGTVEGGKGREVSMMPNGSRIAVHNNGSYATGGSVTVYERDTVTGLFNPLGSTISGESDEYGNYDSSFGRGIDISQDDRVVFGSPDLDSMAGGAFVYQYINFQWEKIWEKVGPGSTTVMNVGSDVSMSNDGKSIVVLTLSPATVEVFVEDEPNPWMSHSLDLSDPTLASTSFTRVAMSGNGMRIVLTDAYYAISGVAYVFDKVGPDLDDWELNRNTPLMPNVEGGYSCGVDVAISHDGTKVIMACPGQSFDEGFAIVYKEKKSGAWSQVGEVIVKDVSSPGSNVNSVAIADIAGGKSAGTNVAVGSRTVVTLDPIGSAAVYNLSSTPCIDSTAEMRLDTMYSDKIPFFCRWVTKGQGSTCSETGYLKDHCPNSCGSCAMYGCSDSTATSFVVNGSETSCMSLTMSGDQTLIEILCQQKKIRTSCRRTCGYCPNPTLF